MAKEESKKYDYDRFGIKAQRVGQAVYDIISHDQPDQSAEETVFEFGPDFVKELEAAIENGRKHYASPFYVLVLSKKEMWACNLMRNYFIARQTFPLGTDMVQQYPNHMKTLYKIDANKGNVTIMWSIPGHQECQIVAKNPAQYDPQLVEWIFQCYAGKFDIDIAPHKI